MGNSVDALCRCGLQVFEKHRQGKQGKRQSRSTNALGVRGAQPSDAPSHGSGHLLRTLFWECTLQCNQQCRHCGSSASSKPSNDISGAEFLRALHNLRNSLYECGQHLPFLAITGGEPLVRRDLIEVMSSAHHALGYRWGLTTNGMLLTPATIERLKDAGMGTASISIDGYGATHDRHRASRGSFSTVTANVSRLLEAGFARQVQITTIVGPHNIDELEQLFALFDGMQGLSSWRLASTDPIGRAAGDGSLALDGAQHRFLLEFILAHNTSKLPVFYACPSHLGEYEMRARDREFCCHAGKSVMSILHNGDIAACPNIPRNQVTVQGNIRNAMAAMNLLSVWDQGYTFHRDPDARHSRFCEGCEVWEDCRGGSLHTFDFEKGQQRKCIRKALL